MDEHHDVSAADLSGGVRLRLRFLGFHVLVMGLPNGNYYNIQVHSILFALNVI